MTARCDEGHAGALSPKGPINPSPAIGPRSNLDARQSTITMMAFHGRSEDACQRMTAALIAALLSVIDCGGSPVAPSVPLASAAPTADVLLFATSLSRRVISCDR
jgi:hypothetical protein